MSTDLSAAPTEVLNGVAEEQEDADCVNQNITVVEPNDMLGVSRRDARVELGPGAPSGPKAAPYRRKKGRASELTSKRKERGESLPPRDFSLGKRKRDQEEEHEMDDLISPPEVVTLSQHLTQDLKKGQVLLKKPMLEDMASVFGFKHPISTTLRVRLAVDAGNGRWHYKDTALAVYRDHRSIKTICFRAYLGGCLFLKRTLGIDKGDYLDLTYLGYPKRDEDLPEVERLYVFKASKCGEAVDEVPDIIIEPRKDSQGDAQEGRDDSMDKIGVEESLSELGLVAPLPGCSLHHELELTGDICRKSLYIRKSLLAAILTDTLGLGRLLRKKGERVPVLVVVEGTVEMQERCNLIVGSSGGNLRRASTLFKALGVQQGGLVRLTYQGYKKVIIDGCYGDELYYFTLEEVEKNSSESFVETPPRARAGPALVTRPDLKSTPTPRRFSISAHAAAPHPLQAHAQGERSRPRVASVVKLATTLPAVPAGTAVPEMLRRSQPQDPQLNAAKLIRDSISRELTQNVMKSLDDMRARVVTELVQEMRAGGDGDEAWRLPTGGERKHSNGESTQGTFDVPGRRQSTRASDPVTELDFRGIDAQQGVPSKTGIAGRQPNHQRRSLERSNNAGNSGPVPRNPAHLAAAPVPAAAAPPAALPAAQSPLPLSVNLACAKSINDAEELMRGFDSGSSSASFSQLSFEQSELAVGRYQDAVRAVSSGISREAVEGNNVFVQGCWVDFEYCDRSQWCGSDVPNMDALTLRRLRASGARPSSSLASVLQGKAPYKLGVGKVQAGVDNNACFGVVALDDIPAGSWIMQWTGDYVMSHNARHQDSSRAVIELQEAAVPVHAVITEAQQAQGAGLLAPTKFAGDANMNWKALPEIVIDSTCRGNAAPFVGRSSDPNVGCTEIDLPTGPTGIFIFAMRDVAKGEELTMLS